MACDFMRTTLVNVCDLKFILYWLNTMLVRMAFPVVPGFVRCEQFPRECVRLWVILCLCVSPFVVAVAVERE